jgi:alanine dehydrogenase
VSGVVHYAVTNMPGAVPHTSTLALTNATFPYVMRLANLGAKKALQSDPGLMEGVNTFKGHITYAAVAESQKQKHVAVMDLL